MGAMERDFAWILRGIELADEAKDYSARYGLVLSAVAMARQLGYGAGFGYDGQPGSDLDGFRIVAYIDLPTGQCSWHMPEYTDEWDGHSTEEKYWRIREYARTQGVA